MSLHAPSRRCYHRAPVLPLAVHLDREAATEPSMLGCWGARGPPLRAWGWSSSRAANSAELHKVWATAAAWKKTSHVIKSISELAMPVTAAHFQSIVAMAGEGHRVLAYRPLADATVKDSPTYTGLLGPVCDCAQALVRSGRGGAEIDQQVGRL